MKMLVSMFVAVLLTGFSLSALGQEKAQLVGAWEMDKAQSQSAADGNTAGLMEKVAIKEDGTFEALYGTKGTWKIAGGKVTVNYPNSFRGDEAASLEGNYLKFPSPAMAGKFCYLKKAGGSVSATSTGGSTAAAPACQEPQKKQIAAGTKVVAAWRGNNWWIANVENISGDVASLTYSDGEKGTRKIAEMKPHPSLLYSNNAAPCWKAGDKVVAKWQGDSWWVATINKIDGDNVSLTYADGEKGVQKAWDMVRH